MRYYNHLSPVEGDMEKGRTERRLLFIDLNNSARFPALAIGYLVAILRSSEYEVEVLSPLSEGVPGFERDLPDTWRDHFIRRIYLSTHPIMARTHDALRRIYLRRAGSPHPRLLSALEHSLSNRRPDLILISTYLDHRPSVEAIASRGSATGVPVLLGGPVFNHVKIASEWAGIPGVTAIFGGEAEEQIVPVCDEIIASGFTTNSGIASTPSGHKAPRLPTLEHLPIPDYSDFPWHLYSRRILPVMTGRGCDWGRCSFCSDVYTANGRGFRSRSVKSVFQELETLSRLYDTRNTFFLDIKLNSDLAMWRGLIERYQGVLPDGRWIGTVHVASRGDNGLDGLTLAAAKASGMARISFGLESGSERLNQIMGKGTQIDRTIQFLEDAKAAGLSVRASMMLGYPGETEGDVRQTAQFLRTYGKLLDRVRISRFKAIPGTRFERLYERYPHRFNDLDHFTWHYGEARAHYLYRPALQRGYRKAKAEVLKSVFEINRKQLSDAAATFNGLM